MRKESIPHLRAQADTLQEFKMCPRLHLTLAPARRLTLWYVYAWMRSQQMQSAAWPLVACFAQRHHTWLEGCSPLGHTLFQD